MRAAVLTVSDGVVAGTREDASGDLLEVLLAADGYEVERRVVADEAGEIAAAIVDLAGTAAPRASSTIAAAISSASSATTRRATS